ncbi:hypothetical protein QJS04_geneDACA017800 [Acorus gramineus]|uniref:Uncharacterized protein n=1 Tax=Acorus gramineus TaxID=55184 RepID=A0AAV9BKV1_ACOGR|nr:hypothetical protein QJS04_geneDACA017800 [Acorus gramineus]
MNGNVCLDIVEEPNRLSNTYSSNVFEPRESSDRADSINGRDRTDNNHAPEKKLTLFALRLSVLEKVASGLGTLGFIWATVVLLGGFAIVLDSTDFWLVTLILLIEGARIFSRSHELEWQHQSTSSWSLADASRNSFRALKSSFHALLDPPSAVRSWWRRSRHHDTAEQQSGSSGQRTWKSTEVPLLPYAGWVFLSKNISKVFYWLQLLSASTCVALSLWRLSEQEFGEVSKGDTDKRNRKAALNIFYGLALAEALMFLLEKAYWEWKVRYQNLLEQVRDECKLGKEGTVSIRRFFYDAYSMCVNGSIFDGLKMDLVSFAQELLSSDSRDEQLIGARILRQFATDERFSDETLRKIGTSASTMERLIEMLNWRNPAEQNIRLWAAEIVSKLAGKKRNSLRVAGIPGAMEDVVIDKQDYEFSAFNLMGLLILKKIANDHDNCGKIGNTRGLLPKIIDYTSASKEVLMAEAPTHAQVKGVQRSLQLVKMMASTTGATGRSLRQEISENVFTISNIRVILQHGRKHLNLQRLGIEILMELALDEKAREMIGSTGGVLKELFEIFFRVVVVVYTERSYGSGRGVDADEVRVAAGEALAMLALENDRNCEHMLKLGEIGRLVNALQDPALRVNSARILRNLCAYSMPECFFGLTGISVAMPMVLKAIMFEKEKLLEVSVGLAIQIFKFSSSEEMEEIFNRNHIKQTDFAERLVEILRVYRQPSIKCPRMRRFVTEMAIELMNSNENYIQFFRHHKMDQELKIVSETTSELECFHVFSGNVGISRHNTPVSSLVETALQFLKAN